MKQDQLTTQQLVVLLEDFEYTKDNGNGTTSKFGLSEKEIKELAKYLKLNLLVYPR